MTTRISIHDVERITTEARYDLDCGAVVRQLVITTATGETATLVMFADDFDKLEVRGDRL